MRTTFGFSAARREEPQRHKEHTVRRTRRDTESPGLRSGGTRMTAAKQSHADDADRRQDEDRSDRNQFFSDPVFDPAFHPRAIASSAGIRVLSLPGVPGTG